MFRLFGRHYDGGGIGKSHHVGERAWPSYERVDFDPAQVKRIAVNFGRTNAESVASRELIEAIEGEDRGFSGLRRVRCARILDHLVRQR